MVVAKITSKGQVTIPKSIRKMLGVGPGDRLVFVRRLDGKVVVEAETVDVRSLRGMLRHDGPPVSVEEMDEAVAREVSP